MAARLDVYARALRTAHEWHAAPSLDALPEVVLTGLAGLVEADAVGWNDFDPGTGRLRALVVPDDGMLLDIAILERLSHQHPLIQRLIAVPMSKAVAMSDFVSRRQFHRLDLYHEFFRPHGIEYQVAFGVATGAFVGIAFNRRAYDFTHDERELLDFLRPHIDLAHATLVAREESQRRLNALELGLDVAGRQVVVLDDGGGVALAGPRALATLARYVRGGIDKLISDLPDAPLVLHGPDGVLTLRRVRGERTVLLLDERRRPTLNEERAAEYRLTGRELDVLSLVALQQTAAEIADALVLSVRTVEKHIENALAKLNVHSRGEAVDLLVDRG